MKYDKLVRDNIPDIIASKGKKVKYRCIVNEQEYQTYLINKLFEEVEELREALETESNILEEIVDVEEVLNTLKNIYVPSYDKTSNQVYDDIKKKKSNSKGLFSKGVILLEVEE